MTKQKSNTATRIPKSKAKTAYGLLSEVRTLILAEPLRYNQVSWLERQSEAIETETVFPACGTVGCVAGWVSTLVRGDTFSWSETGPVATLALGLSDQQADELFAASAAGYGRRQTARHAAAGAKHIAAFQKKYRRQLLAKKVQS